MLHVTNGDHVVEGFRDGGVPGAYLPWRDVLHDGPVPHRDTLEELSAIRGKVVGGDFTERDAALTAFRDHDEVVLWFEHDLYDQLQLLQILDWFSRQDLGGTRLSLIQIGSHPDVTPFYGLGQLTGAQLAALLPGRKPVTGHQLDVASRAWRAFCSPEPSALRPFADRSDPEMPFLQAALRRFLEEYPSDRDRLSRTERQLLAAAAVGAKTMRQLYDATQQLEPWPWGDMSVFARIDGLAEGPHAALDRRGDLFAITDIGRGLLAADPAVVRSRTVDTWLGGAHVIIR